VRLRLALREFDIDWAYGPENGAFTPGYRPDRSQLEIPLRQNV
jgi:hypothetical protein